MVWKVLCGFYGVTSWGLSIPAQHLFGYDIWYDPSNNYVGSILVAVRLRRLNILTQNLVLRDIVFVSTDIKTLVDARCSSPMLNTNSTFLTARMFSNTVTISYEADSWGMNLSYYKPAGLSASNEKTARSCIHFECR